MFIRVQVSTLLAAALVATAISGCGGDKRDLAMSTVSGTVTYKTALPEGQIVFQHESGESAATKFGADGKYTLDVPQGKNQVIVRSIESTLPTPPAEGAAPGPRGMEVHKSRIPESYANFGTSGLSFDVKDGPQTYNIELTGDVVDTNTPVTPQP